MGTDRLHRWQNPGSKREDDLRREVSPDELDRFGLIE